MAQEHHRHHLFHHHNHKEDADNAPLDVSYSETAYPMSSGNMRDDEYGEAKDDEKHRKRMEHLAGLGGIATGAFALHEKHEGKKDPEHAGRHNLEEELAEGAALGEEGYAFHEHHKMKDAKDARGTKHHGFF